MEEHYLKKTFYRVSAKGLLWDSSREKFAIILEDNDWWELPGGGLDYGESPEECLKREVQEEMGLEVIRVSQSPTHILIGENMGGKRSLNIVYEIEVKNLDFTPTEECLEIKFVTPEEAIEMNSWRNVKELANELIKNRE